VPISFINNRLTLAMTDPNNIIAFDDIRRVLKGVMIGSRRRWTCCSSEIIRELQLTEDQTVVETKQRVGIYEVMRLNSELRQLIVKGIPAEELHAAAVAGSMIDVKRYAALVLAEGLTSTEEVTSVIAMGD
jgi:type II secretory ATPase GspE/PulE/Tfp pilus assembly ATPase PilB-like protein